MATTSPIRIEDDIYESARLVAPLEDRSVSQQVAHWARIGRELEAAPTVSHASIAAVLAGAAAYDALTEFEQAVVRAAWDERISQHLATLDLAVELGRDGRRTYVELDESGAVVERALPDPT